MEYQVTIKKFIQTSPDDWELIDESLKVNDNTTIGEITQWVKSGWANQGDHCQFKVVQLLSL